MAGKKLYIKYKEIIDGLSVEKVRYAVEKWQAEDKYMGESFITFSAKSSKPIGFRVGDYCEYRGETYMLNYVPSVIQKGNIGDSGDSFVYESVKFDSAREELDRIKMLDITPTTGDYIPEKETNYTGSAQFKLYCGETIVNGKTRPPVCTLAGKIQANLDRAYPDKGWKVLVDTDSTHEEAGEQVLNTHSDEMELVFDNTTVTSALAEVKSRFDIDYAIKGRTIYIGYTFGSITGNDDEYYYFGYGRGYLSKDNQGKALFELRRTSDSNQKIVTRLRAMGSTKNMPYRYYNKRYNLSQAMFPTNLQLPDTFETPTVKASNNALRKSMYPWIRDVLGETNDAYIDKNDNCLDTIEGLREECLRWDGSNSDLKEIYPSIEEVTYKDLRGALCPDMEDKKGASSFANYLDTERVDEIFGVGEDANVGDGIKTEGNTSRQTLNDAEVKLWSDETQSSLTYTGTNYVSKERTVMSLTSQYAGEYIISNSHLYFGASYSLGRHQSESVTKSCGVAYKIKVYAKPLGSSSETVICEYLSDFKTITNREDKEYETLVANLPDSEAATPKVEKIELTSVSDIRITFSLVVSGLDYNYDQYTVSWRLGLPKTSGVETETDWTPSLIWDLKNSASTFMQNPFHVYVKDMGFDFVAQFSTSDEPRISMKTGMCVAREFKIGNNPEKVKITKDGKTYNAWKLTLGRAEDKDLNTYYPSENYPLSSGDKFVILGIEMPEVYINAASMKLLVEATKALADLCETKHEYEPKIDEIYLQRNYDRCEEEGDATKSVYWKLASGMKFPFFGVRESEDESPSTFTMIIDTLSIIEGDGMLPKVTIKLSEDFQQSTIQKITRQITEITNGSIFDSTNISAGSIDQAAVKAIVSDYTKTRYLSKKDDDTAAGFITFLRGLAAKEEITAEDGIRFGQYINGFLGSGAYIDNRGRAEFESIFSRSFISTPELRYNRIAVTEGEQWCTNGYGIIESVDTEAKTITLHLEENDYASVAKGDLCRGVYNNFGTSEEYQNTTTLDADNCGFPIKAGFFTSYFRVKEILEQSQGKCVFAYELRNDSTPHPCAQMKFAQYGNDILEERQASAYMSSTGHFYFQSLEKVSTWEISSVNVTIRFGWVDGFPVKLTGGSYQTLKGYGLYAPDNIYFGNAIVQLDPKTVDSLRKDLQQYTIELSSYTDVITVDDAGNVIDGLYKLAVEGDLTTKYDYRIAPAVFVKKGNEYLIEADSGDDAAEGTYKMYVTPKNCTAEIINGTVCVTAIDNIKDGVSGTADDVDFDYDAMRKMESISVVISVMCEGRGSITKEFKVAIKHDSKPYISMSMDNQNASVSWNTKAQEYIGLPYSFNVTAARANDLTPISEVSVVAPEGVTVTSEIQKGVAVLTVTSLPQTLDNVTNIKVTATAKYAGIDYEQTLVHTLNRYEDVNVYELKPSVTQVVASVNTSGEKVADVEKVTCSVLCSSSDDKQYILTTEQMTTVKAVIKYSIDDGATLSDCPADGLSVSPEWSKIVFHLLIDGSEVDSQDVPVMLNGVDGNGIEYVFLLTTEDKKPTIYDDSTTEAFQSPDYCPYTDAAHTRQWTDEPTGVGINNRYEWVAQRKKQYGKWLAFSEAKKWTVYAIDGTSPYSLDLTNESSQVLCDQDGNVIGGYETTTIQLFHGASVMSISDFTITITATNISYSLSGAVITPSAFESGKDSAQIAVKAVLKTNTSIVLTAVYSITKNKAGKDGVIYSLQPSVSTFSKDSNGGWVTKSFYLYVKKTAGTGATEITTLAALNAEELTLKYGTTTVTSSTLELVPSTICDSNAYADLYLYKGSVVIDRERINVVSDGENGEDGNGITGIDVYYQSADSDTTPPTGEWLVSSPALTEGKPYLWSMTVYHYTELSDSTTMACIGKLGDKGMDGDSVEYIYKLTATEEQPAVPESSAPIISNKKGDWTDDPQGVSEEYPYEWVSEHTKTNGVWGAYTAASVWAKWGDKGDKGDQGEKGDDAYEITMSNLNLTYNSRKGNIDGNHPVSQLEVNIQCSKGGTPLKYTNGTADDWVCSTLTENVSDPIIDGVLWSFKVSEDGYTFTYVIYCKTTNKVDIEIPFIVTAGGVQRQYKIHLQSYEDGGTPLNRGIWSSEGYIDENGEATNGYFYRYKGDTLIRDLVAYKIGGIYYYYLVKNFTGDTPVTEAPATAVTTEVPVEIVDEETGETTTSVSEEVTYQTSDKWEQMSKVKTIFSEVIYADDATIGGFHANATNLWSGGDTPDTASVSLDGETGEINSRGADASIRLANGLLEVFNNLGTCNIRFGLRNGYAVLSYYDNDGNLLYDLGPNGIQASNVQESSITEYRLWHPQSSLGQPFHEVKYLSSTGIWLDELTEGSTAYNLANISTLWAGGKGSKPWSTDKEEKDVITVYKYRAAKLNNVYAADSRLNLTQALAEQCDGLYFTRNYIDSDDIAAGRSLWDYRVVGAYGILEGTNVGAVPAPMQGYAPRYGITGVGILNGAISRYRAVSLEVINVSLEVIK